MARVVWSCSPLPSSGASPVVGGVLRSLLLSLSLRQLCLVLPSIPALPASRYWVFCRSRLPRGLCRRCLWLWGSCGLGASTWIAGWGLDWLCVLVRYNGFEWVLCVCLVRILGVVFLCASPQSAIAISPSSRRGLFDASNLPVHHLTSSGISPMGPLATIYITVFFTSPSSSSTASKLSIERVVPSSAASSV